MKKGFIWPSVFVGHGEVRGCSVQTPWVLLISEIWVFCGLQMDPMQQEATKQQMMLERFQEENPGFDFSNAEFNGAAPDPRTFMGGVKYT
jgi:hypothetical protein